MTQTDVNFILYISLPFCHIRCNSCPYSITSLPSKSQKLKEDQYVDLLVKDLKCCSKYQKWKEGLIRDIYISGSTNNILKISNLKKIEDAIFDNFSVSPDCYFTLEINIQDYSEEKIKYILSSRINRISFGVKLFQLFDCKEAFHLNHALIVALRTPLKKQNYP